MDAPTVTREGETPLKHERAETALESSKRLLDLIRDKDLPTILFLSINPNKFVEEDDNIVSENPDFTRKICRSFEKALVSGSYSPLREEAKLRIMNLLDKCKELTSSRTSITLSNNFNSSRDSLSEAEEEILQFSEILNMFGHPVPQAISETSENIIFTRKIPAVTEDGYKRWKTYFVYSENKVLMKICNKLTEEEVRYMYQFFHKETSSSTLDCDTDQALSQDEDSEDGDDSCLPSRDTKTRVIMRVKCQLKPEIFSGKLKGMIELKDVAFYYFVLVLMKERIQTRLHLHTLYSIFDSLKELEKAQPRIDDILSQLGRYPIASDPPGLCIILTMEEGREGAREDRKNVKELFGSHYRYDVVEKINPTKEQIADIIREVETSRNKFYDSLVVWFMSHGDKKLLKVKNGEIHKRQEFIQPFTEIEWFLKKPKLFFIQACATRHRYSTSQATFQSAHNESLGNGTDSLTDFEPNAGDTWRRDYGHRTNVCDMNPFADTLVCYATKWYEKATRERKGSLYVNTVLDQLQRFGHLEPIETVLHRVHYNTNTVQLRKKKEAKVWKQSPYFESSLQKAFLFPEPQRLKV
ncbi:uncharacterized protein [Panulirus ornatus]|uniref:uncharacterized protein isoform X2 n=1 Tax=Panulirus ornatus TaxID=150431 RepID=UPI003A8A72A5